MEKIDITKVEKLRSRISESRKSEKTTITVCGGTGCHAYGCLKVSQAFKEEIKKQNLLDQVEVRTTGCHGFCERGPIVVIQPDGTFYQRVQVKDVQDIISVTILDKKIIDRLLYIDPRTKEKIDANIRRAKQVAKGNLRNAKKAATAPKGNRASPGKGEPDNPGDSLSKLGCKTYQKDGNN